MESLFDVIKWNLIESAKNIYALCEIKNSHDLFSLNRPLSFFYTRGSDWRGFDTQGGHSWGDDVHGGGGNADGKGATPGGNGNLDGDGPFDRDGDDDAKMGMKRMQMTRLRPRKMTEDDTLICRWWR